MSPNRNPGRYAGFLYLLMSAFAPFALIYVPSKLIVHGNATATANNIAASQMMFSLGIVAELISQVIFIFVVLALYDLLKGVNKRQAALMVIFVLVSVPIAFFNEVNALAAVVLARGADFLSTFDKPQRDALTMLFINLHHQGYMVTQIFWGLWLFPLGLLVYRSGFIPRILGILLIINSFTYPLDSLTDMLLPQYVHTVDHWLTLPQLGELWLMLWLLIKGAIPKPSAVQADTVIA